MIKKIIHNTIEYGIINIKYKNIYLPLLIDWDKSKYFSKDIIKNIKCMKNGKVYLLLNKNKYFIHDIIMLAHNNLTPHNKYIYHINKIGLDNRINNLTFNKVNINKKKRNHELLEEMGIDPNDIPSYIWYEKANKNNGDRFIVNINNIKWKSKSSKDIKTIDKLNDAKKYMNELLINNPEIFTDNNANGDMSSDGIELLNSFFKIINTIYPNLTLKDISIKDNTKSLLKNINNDHKVIDNDNYDMYGKKKLPKYGYYSKKTSKKNDYYYIKNHPSVSYWQTTSSKNITTHDKYIQFMNYYNSL